MKYIFIIAIFLCLSSCCKDKLLIQSDCILMNRSQRPLKLNFYAEGTLQETAFLPISDTKTQTAYEVEALVNTYLTYDSIELVFEDTIQVMHKWDSVSKTFLPSNSRSMLNGDNYQLELITEDHRTLTFQITEQDYLDAL